MITPDALVPNGARPWEGWIGMAISVRRGWGPASVAITMLTLVAAMTVVASPASAAAHPTVANVAPNAGAPAGGNAVEVTGTGFTQVSSVRFGSTAARSVAVVSSTELTAVAPKHAAGRTDIRIVTAHGTSAIVGNAARYTYVAAPRALRVSAPQSFDSTDTKSLSCVSAAFCASFDIDGAATEFESGAWQTPVAVSGGPTSVSCVSATFCLATDQNGHTYQWNGASWADDSAAGDFGGPLSCVSSTFCLAVNGSGQTSTFNGTTWSAPAYISPGVISGLYSVSCVSPSFCYAVGLSQLQFRDVQYGIGVVFRDDTWQAPQTIDTRGGLSSVSCPTIYFCAAATVNGLRVWTGGASWSKVIEPAGSDGHVAAVASVDCTNATFCVAFWQDATTGEPHWVRFDGAATADQTFAGGHFPAFASCWARYACQFVNSDDAYTTS
jgi:hypothetical protein